MEQLAAREVRRYVYLRTGRLLPMMTERAGALPKGNLILVGRKDRPLVSLRAVLGAAGFAGATELLAQDNPP